MDEAAAPTVPEDAGSHYDSVGDSSQSDVMNEADTRAAEDSNVMSESEDSDLPPLDAPASREAYPCSMMSDQPSRLSRLRLAVPSTQLCDSNSDGMLDVLDEELNSGMEALGLRAALNDLLEQHIQSGSFVLIYDSRGWEGFPVKAIMDLYPASVKTPTCKALGESCEYTIPPESQNFNGCATTGIHGVEYGPPDTVFSSVTANVLLTPPLFSLQTALLFEQSRFQGQIAADGAISAGAWCGELDGAALRARLVESCAGQTGGLCEILLTAVDEGICGDRCTVTLEVETVGVDVIVKLPVVRKTQN